MFNTIIIYTLTSQQAEQILKHAERVLRLNWNMHGFKRIDSGWMQITTDGFGNPYNHERELKVYGIAVEVPKGMNYREAMTFLRCGDRKVNCYTEYYFN